VPEVLLEVVIEEGDQSEPPDLGDMREFVPDDPSQLSFFTIKNPRGEIDAPPKGNANDSG